MALFDPFATEFAFWVQHVNPRRYDAMLGADLPPVVDLAVDAGCGPGQLALFLASRARRVVGIDASPAMLTVAQQEQRRRGLANVSFVCADIAAGPLPPGCAAFVGCDCVLHDTALDATLPALRRLVAPGGLLVVRDLVVAHPRRAQSVLWQALRTARRAPGYVQRFGVSTARRLLAFEGHPAWLRHRARHPRLTPDGFVAAYGRHLPGARFVHYGWASAAFWPAPPS